MRNRYCHELSNGTVDCSPEICQQIDGNGASKFALFCWGCKARVSQDWIPKEAVAKLLGIDRAELPNAIPVVKVLPGRPCSVKGCTSTETELHHWAPRAKFSAADDWPTSYLCLEHHREWHSVMTPTSERARSLTGYATHPAGFSGSSASLWSPVPWQP